MVAIFQRNLLGKSAASQAVAGAFDDFSFVKNDCAHARQIVGFALCGEQFFERLPIAESDYAYENQREHFHGKKGLMKDWCEHCGFRGGVKKHSL